MEKFYSIKLIGRTRGYTTQSSKGIILSENFADACHKFSDIKEAREFIKKNKLEKNGYLAVIRTSEEVEAEKEKVAKSVGVNRGCFKIVNEKGEVAHYNTKTSHYFWKNEDSGCAEFHDKPTVKDYVQKIQRYFPNMKIRAKKLK